MPILHALVLGIVQGLTEFLPISSSGHLELVPWLFGWKDIADESVAKAFDTALHLGTLVAVVFYVRRDLAQYVSGGLGALRHPRHASTTGKAAWLFVASAIPAGLVGLVAQDWITESLGGAGSIAVSLIVFGGVLWWADRRAGERTVEDYRLREAVLTGCAQVLALNPGTSRSGITISMARVVGFSRDAAARISFLMSIPVIAAA
ncbi:MAG: undecaprenyl-diphosphate phosphatase, partial [Actinobacteria bacterium]|nr:undecaprenyl-diphosphate phosphatase [Actinomycetota bacterium]